MERYCTALDLNKVIFIRQQDTNLQNKQLPFLATFSKVYRSINPGFTEYSRHKLQKFVCDLAAYCPHP
jgi:hypothetical protein